MYNDHKFKGLRRALRAKETYSERALWLQLKDRRLLGLKFRRQYSLMNFIVDFYCAELKLAIELDGTIHNNADVMQRDARRQEVIESVGVHFVRITNEELHENANLAVQKIITAVKTLRAIK